MQLNNSVFMYNVSLNDLQQVRIQIACHAISIHLQLHSNYSPRKPQSVVSLKATNTNPLSLGFDPFSDTQTPNARKADHQHIVVDKEAAGCV